VPPSRVLDSSEPEGRLPDAGLALEHERGRASFSLVEEGLDGGELVPPADNFERHGPLGIVAQGEKPCKRAALEGCGDLACVRLGRANRQPHRTSVVPRIPRRLAPGTRRDWRFDWRNALDFASIEAEAFDRDARLSL
jgi:hypothetical protein